MKPLAITKPTGLTRKNDALILSLDLHVEYEDGMIVDVAWSARSFDTAVLENVPLLEHARAVVDSHTFGGQCNKLSALKRVLTDLSLGHIRRAINDAFEPQCRDHCTNAAHDAEYIKIEQDNSERLRICNPRRTVCNDASHDDQNHYDHTLHKTCKPRRNIILLLSEKEKCIGDLKALGCDPYKKCVSA